MKKIFIMALGILLCATCIEAQTSKEVIKERKKIARLSRIELNEKASKDARREAKTNEREGWKAAPGHLPLEKQFDKAYLMQYEYDSNMYPKYMFGEAMSVGESYDAAMMQALELAKLNLAGQIQTEMTALIQNTVSNRQLPEEQAASITETILASKNRISQSLGRVIPVIELYRDKENKRKEVRIMIAYDSNMAFEAAKNSIREDLNAKGDSLMEELDKIINF